jgi:hypothetical protein
MDDQELIPAMLASDSARFNRIKPFGNPSRGLFSAVRASHDVSRHWIQVVFFLCSLNGRTLPHVYAGAQFDALQTVEIALTGEFGTNCVANDVESPPVAN